MAKSKKPKHNPEWAKAKNVCRLNMEDIRMAKELGLSPRALMKNNPSPTQRWKLPVKQWIRELYEKRFGRRRQRAMEPAGDSINPSNGHSLQQLAVDPAPVSNVVESSSLEPEPF